MIGPALHETFRWAQQCKSLPTSVVCSISFRVKLRGKKTSIGVFSYIGEPFTMLFFGLKKKKKKISAVPGTSWAEFDQHTDVEQMKCIMHVMHIDKWAELSSSPPAAISRARSMHNQNADRRRRLHRRRWNKSKINFGFFSSSRLTPSSWINPYKS